MKKYFNFMFLALFAPIVLLSGCGQKKMPSASTVVSKLEKSGYEVIVKTEATEIEETIAYIVDSYNAYVAQYNLENQENENYVPFETVNMREISVKKLISGQKENSKAIFFYCENESSAVLLSRSLHATYMELFGEESAFSGQNGKFVYLYSAEVENLFKLNS